MPKVLILDDSPVLLAVARASLEAAGNVVATRQSPIGFSMALHDEKPDLALIDVLMPGVAGPRLVEIVKSRRSVRGTRLVLYSGIRESELVALVRTCGADGFIVKSRYPADLPRRVNEILGPARADSRGSK
jgi:DNA-binding NarL/FixJ family response regulator